MPRISEQSGRSDHSLHTGHLGRYAENALGEFAHHGGCGISAGEMDAGVEGSEPKPSLFEPGLDQLERVHQAQRVNAFGGEAGTSLRDVRDAAEVRPYLEEQLLHTPDSRDRLGRHVDGDVFAADLDRVGVNEIRADRAKLRRARAKVDDERAAPLVFGAEQGVRRGHRSEGGLADFNHQGFVIPEFDARPARFQMFASEVAQEDFLLLTGVVDDAIYVAPGFALEERVRERIEEEDFLEGIVAPKPATAPEVLGGMVRVVQTTQ